LIKSNGGNILCENRIGTRRLAYEIAGLNQGYYTQLFFEAPQAALPVLDRFYKLEEAFMRFMTVTFEGPVPSPEDLNRSIADDDRDDRRDRHDRDDDDDDNRRHRGSGRREERSGSDRPRETAKPQEAPRAEAPKEEAPKAEATKPEAPKEEAADKPAAPAETASTEAPTEPASESKFNPSDDDIL